MIIIGRYRTPIKQRKYERFCEWTPCIVLHCCHCWPNIHGHIYLYWMRVSIPNSWALEILFTEWVDLIISLKRRTKWNIHISIKTGETGWGNWLHSFLNKAFSISNTVQASQLLPVAGCLLFCYLPNEDYSNNCSDWLTSRCQPHP